MKFRHSVIFLLLWLSVFTINAASVKADATTEIQYLLSFIDQSSCIFIRNGTEYDAQDARKHIEKKYNYLKSRLNSADDFIEQAASKSSFSGEAYKVKCSEQYLTTEQWLLAALKDYRLTE